MMLSVRLWGLQYETLLYMGREIRNGIQIIHVALCED
jgi:hypothetical protein